MKQAFLDVMEWRLKTAGLGGIPRWPTTSPEEISDDVVELMAKLIEEEGVKELAKAIRARDIHEIADGLADLVWVCLEAALKLGIDLPAVWEEVKQSNLAKVKDGVIRREDGKIMKPAGWRPPDVAVVLQLQRPVKETYDDEIKMILD